MEVFASSRKTSGPADAVPTSFFGEESAENGVESPDHPAVMGTKRVALESVLLGEGQALHELLCVRPFDPPGTIEAFAPVGFSHVFHPDFASGARRVDELTLPNIDADMAEGPSHGVEKHQIPRFEFFDWNLGGDLSLF